MKHFYFTENNTGEGFIVGAKSLASAKVIAKDVAYNIAEWEGYDPDLSYEYEMTEEEAENSGLDEY